MTHLPPRTLNFHNWLLTTKLQGTFETREESTNTSASTYSWLRQGSQPAMIPPWFCTATNQEQLQPNPWRDTSRDERRIWSGVLQGGLRCFTASPANGALNVTKQSPDSYSPTGWHFSLLQHFPHMNKLTWVTCSGEHSEGKGLAGQVLLFAVIGTKARHISKVAPNSCRDQKKSVLKGKSCRCK